MAAHSFTTLYCHIHRHMSNKVNRPLSTSVFTRVASGRCSPLRLSSPIQKHTHAAQLRGNSILGCGPIRLISCEFLLLWCVRTRLAVFERSSSCLTGLLSLISGWVQLQQASPGSTFTQGPKPPAPSQEHFKANMLQFLHLPTFICIQDCFWTGQKEAEGAFQGSHIKF